MTFKAPDYLSEAEKLTWHLDGPDGSDRKFRHELFVHLPVKAAIAIAKTYKRIYTKVSRQKANLYLLDIKNRLTPKTINIASSVDGVEIYTKSVLKTCLMYKRLISDQITLFQQLCKICDSEYIKPPVLSSSVSIEGAIKRLLDQQWWSSKLRRYHRERYETGMIQAGLVHKKSALYVSDQTLKTHLALKDRNTRILESLLAINEENDAQIPLSELAEHSQSNPHNRRCELMVRLHGTDKLSQEVGHKAIFITLTCPSRMHARYAKSGDPNKIYDGTTPHQANNYLSQLWSRIRAKFKRDNIHIYGIRVAEPQHDGTPHWHILLFTGTRHINTVKSIFTQYALQDSPDELGALRHRVTFEDIDPKKGSATGYIAKYISKNIDGKHLDKDLYGHNAASSSQRVAAWASVFNIRQFQFFGSAPVGLWRELRRLEGTPEGIITDAFQAADKGDWQAFINTLGGIGQENKLIPIKTLKTWVDDKGKYGEPIGERVLGVTDGQHDVISRDLGWKIKKRKINVAYSSGCMAAAMHPDEQATWSTVNNCTQIGLE